MASGSLTSEQLLWAFAYVLLFVAVAPKLARYDHITWALLPLWLVLTGYVANIMKSTTKDKETSDKYASVAWLVWFTYYTLALVWPYPLHWYDSLVMISLLVPQGLTTSALMSVYYVASAAHYMGEGAVLQVAGRSILTVLSAMAAAKAYDAREFEPHYRNVARW